jgi:tRNA-binding protein
MNPAPIKPLISTSDLDKIDVRVGTILAVEDVAHSEKLVRLRVDFGDHARSILVGMKKERPSPKEIEGRQALFVVNLAPRKVAGEISEGLLFDIGYARAPSKRAANPPTLAALDRRPRGFEHRQCRAARGIKFVNER